LKEDEKNGHGEKKMIDFINMEPCYRLSFGTPKLTRGVYTDKSIIFMHTTGAVDLLKYMEDHGKELPDYIEKEWPEVGWEICWVKGKGWV